MTEAITSDNYYLSKPIFGTPEAANYVDTGAEFLVVSLEPAVRDLVEATTAPNTRRAYQNDLRQFLAWGGSIPARPDMVAAYVAAHAKTLSVATLARRVVAIGRAHELRGLPKPTNSELVRAYTPSGPPAPWTSAATRRAPQGGGSIRHRLRARQLDAGRS
jgi:Phage integrase, N-terminal SAM-like domain